MERFVPGPIVFRGQTYRSVGEMPTEVRQAYEQILRMLDETVPAGTPDDWEEWGPDARLSPAPSLSALRRFIRVDWPPRRPGGGHELAIADRQ